MSLFVKNLKTLMSSEDYSYYQHQAKNYSKMYAVLTETKPQGNNAGSNTSNSNSNSSNGLSSSEGNSGNSGGNIFSNPNSFNGELIKEQVLKWFFSLPLESRIKVATVENKLLAYMFHQMYYYYKQQTKLVFQMREETLKDSSLEKTGIKVNDSTFKEDDTYQNSISNFFNFLSNKTDKNDSMMENILLGDTKFLSLHSDLDSVTLSTRVLKDPSLFNHYFKYIGHSKSFFSLIKPFQDPKTKLFAYHLPDWINPKDYYSIGNFIVAFIEQTILIKFVLNYNRKDKYIYSLQNEKRMAEVFQKRKQVIECLKKYFNNENRSDLFEKINARRIHNDIFYNKDIESIIKNRNKFYDAGYRSFVSLKMTQAKDPCFFGSSDLETEKKVMEKYKNEDIIYFVDDTLYHGLDSLWKENYFISVRLFEDLHDLYTEKNYEELIQDMEETEKLRKNTNKKGKKNLGKDSLNNGGNLNSDSPKKGKKKKASINLLDSPLEDPDFELYSVYFKDQKSYYNHNQHTHNSTHNSKIVSKTMGIENSSTSKSDNKNNKDYLYGAYQSGQRNMILDYVKNYIIKEMIDNSVVRTRDPIIPPPKSDFSNKVHLDLINDLCSISSKSKLIGSMLNKGVSNTNSSEKTNDVVLSKSSQEEVDKKPIDRSNTTNSDTFSRETNWNNFDDNSINTINKDHKIEKENSSEIIKSDNYDTEKEDIVNYEDFNKNINSDYPSNKAAEENSETDVHPDCESRQNKTDNEDKAVQTSDNNEQEKEVTSRPTGKEKKKKKEPNFFLYDTSKKRKEKPATNNNSNSNNIINNNVSKMGSKRNSNESETINKDKEIVTIGIHSKDDIKNKNSPNNMTIKVKNNIDINNYNTNSNLHKNQNYNQSYKKNLNKHNYNSSNNNNNFHTSSGESQKEKKYKSNNYHSNRNYRNKNNENRNQILSNNYYIINSITHVTPNAMMNPMMMYQITPMNQGGSVNPISSINPVPPINSMPTYPLGIVPHSSTPQMSNMSAMVGNINFNKYSNDFLTFVYKLHNDIITYHKSVTETLESLKEVKIYVIQYIEKLINQQISENFSIDVYGSFASDLSIESSDIDIKIRVKACEGDKPFDFDLDQTIMLLVKNFNSLNIFESVIPIYTASVPIIKIVCDPSKIADDDNLMKLEEFKNSENFKNYKFNKEEIEKIKIDLTFLDMVVKGYGTNTSNQNLININPNHSMSSVEFAKNKLILYPEIKPLLQVLKRYLQINKLNNCFNGGLSSFCLFLLILSFIKFKLISQPQTSQNNLGRLLLDFLEFYGRMFNFHGCTIDVNLPNPFVINNDIFEKSPVILDPLSYLNASKSSYRISEVKECFAEALDFLNVYKLKYDKIDVGANSSNIVYDLLLKK